MSVSEQDRLTQQLDDISKRIATRRSNLAGRADAQSAQQRLESLAKREQELRKRISGTQTVDWEREREHIVREHGLIYETLVELERELTEDENHPHGRAPGARSGLV